ncbi:MAG TPA: TIR domain-containing protein [Steroidobacteraceae bacterium]
MSEPSKAVFLSYASQDAAVARPIAEALRAAGIEVWFDQSELRGGDVWDQTIRRHIRDCALFVPIISAHTQARPEGYFRLEWRLAEQRTHLMGRSRAFIVPVCVDDTPQTEADVPDSFSAAQWTRLPAGNTPNDFVERISRLLVSHEQVTSIAGRPPAGAEPVAASLQTHASAGLKETQRNRRTPGAKLVWLLVAAAVVIAAGYFAVDRSLFSKRAVESSSPAVQSTATAPNAIPEKSIAVLPFVDLSEKKDQEYFSDGLAEELIDLLAQVPNLKVSARTSSFYFKGKSEDVATIAQKLRVANVLEGSVRKAGNTIRVTAQLIRADNGYHLWSKTYDQDVKDIFKVQDEIAAAVVAALKAQLLPTQQISSRHRTDNTEAYTEYLVGNQFRARDTVEANTQALAAYRKAVALDAGYAAAYSGIADAQWRLADQSTGQPADYVNALAAAEKAIALAPDSPEGYWARAQLRNYYYFDWHGAEADFQKALELDASFVPAQVDYAALLATLGRVPDGLTILRATVALDPLSVPAWRQLARLLTDSGRFAEARVAAQRVAEGSVGGDPGQTGGFIDLFDGRPQQALANAQVNTSMYYLMLAAMANHTLGHSTESQRALDELIRRGANTLAYQIGEVYAWRGERDKAFEWLERALRQHDGGLTYIKNDRPLASLRSDPRYHALLRTLKLPD